MMTSVEPRKISRFLVRTWIDFCFDKACLRSNFNVKHDFLHHTFWYCLQYAVNHCLLALIWGCITKKQDRRNRGGRGMMIPHPHRFGQISSNRTRLGILCPHITTSFPHDFHTFLRHWKLVDWQHLSEDFESVLDSVYN